MFGEIFIAQFPFTSGGLSKSRPVLALFDLGQDVVICRITSVLHGDPCDVVLADWKIEGLAKPSVVRLDRLVTAEKILLRKRLGKLSATDDASVRRIWNQHMQL